MINFIIWTVTIITCFLILKKEFNKQKGKKKKYNIVDKQMVKEFMGIHKLDKVHYGIYEDWTSTFEEVKLIDHELIFHDASVLKVDCKYTPCIKYKREYIKVCKEVKDGN